MSLLVLASNKPVQLNTVDCRAGDVAAQSIDAGLAEILQGWFAQHDLVEVCADAWQVANPSGYDQATCAP